MTRPIVGLCVDVSERPDDDRSALMLSLRANYAEAVAAAGGVPLLIPPSAPAEEALAAIDGLLIPGGDDIDPARYGAAPHPQNAYQHPVRYESESELYRLAPPEMPVLGICHGCQLINVLEGGTLLQHLPDVEGALVHTGGGFQAVALTPDSLAASALGSTSATGRTYHHQGVGEPGPRVRVVGRAEDGIPEAIEVAGRAWTVGVQWHPERSPGDPAMRRLFETFVAEARAYRARRGAAVAAG